MQDYDNINNLLSKFEKKISILNFIKLFNHSNRQNKLTLATDTKRT
jgi:hypothetical protein